MSSWVPGTFRNIGTWRWMCGPTRSKISSRLGPVIVSPWFLRPMIARARLRRDADQVGDGVGQLGRAAWVVDLRGGDAVDPGMDVHDRADARGARGRSSSARSRRPRRGAARFRAAPTAPSRCSRVVARDHQDVAADLAQAGLVDARRAHPEPARVLAGREVAVGQAADRVEPLHVRQVARRQDLVDRPRRGQQLQLVELLAGGGQRRGDLVAVPQLGLQVRVPDVLDHEVRLGERREPLDDPVVERRRVASAKEIS